LIAWSAGQDDAMSTERGGNITGGVSRVDDTQGPRVAVAPGFVQGPLQLADVHAPALLLVQVIVDLHGGQLGERSRVQGVLRDGDHHARTGRALAAHQQLQHGLREQHEGCGGRRQPNSGAYVQVLASHPRGLHRHEASTSESTEEFGAPRETSRSSTRGLKSLLFLSSAVTHRERRLLEMKWYEQETFLKLKWIFDSL